MQEEKIKITAIIKTRNSENSICNTLESLRDFDEIIVIDEHSSDDTVEIAKEYKAKIIFSDILEFASTFNSALQEARNEWIFLIEENEIISQKLVFEMEKYIQNPKKNKNCVAFYQRFFYLNKEIKSALKKDVIRLFKKECVEFCNDFSFECKPLNKKMHKIKPTKNSKNACILKYKKNDVEKNMLDIMEKARNMLKVTNKKKASIFLKPILSFINIYFFKKAIFEGIRGFVYAKDVYFEKYIFEMMLFEKINKEVKNDF